MVPNPDGPGLKKVIKKVGDQGNLDFTRLFVWQILITSCFGCKIQNYFIGTKDLNFSDVYKLDSSGIAFK